MPSHSQISNVRRLHAPRNQVSFREGIGRRVLRFDEDALTTEWRIGERFRRLRYDLIGVSPQVIVDSTPYLGDPRGLRIAVLSLALAVVVFFSDYSASIPLLAPFFVAIGVAQAVAAMRFMELGPRTIVTDTDGHELALLPHARIDPDERIGFEKALSEAVRNAQRRWYEDEY